MEFPTYEQFMAWLESKPPKAIVGIAMRSDQCPGTNCLRDFGAPDPRISSRAWTDGSEPRGAMPLYAQRFVNDIDLLFGIDNPVSAEQALIILKGITP